MTLKSPGKIRFGKKRDPRAPRFAEAKGLVIDALSVIGQWTGVKITNLSFDGRPVALAVIEGAEFDEEANLVLKEEENAKTNAEAGK